MFLLTYTNCIQTPITHLETRRSNCACKCVDLDRGHSARRAYLNSWTARDRLIVSNGFYFIFIYPRHFCFVWYRLRTTWFRVCNASISCSLFLPPQTVMPARNLTEWRGDLLLALIYQKRSRVRFRAPNLFFSFFLSFSPSFFFLLGLRSGIVDKILSLRERFMSSMKYEVCCVVLIPLWNIWQGCSLRMRLVV